MNPAIRKSLGWSFFATVIVYFLMRKVTNGISGREIVDFEMAKTPERAAELTKFWTPEYQQHFVNGIYIDFLFLICYTIMLYSAARFFGELSKHYVLRKAGNFFAVLSIIAGICDIVENIGMLITIKKQAYTTMVHLTYDMALVKFSIILIVLLFSIIGLLFFLLSLTERKKYRI